MYNNDVRELAKKIPAALLACSLLISVASLVGRIASFRGLSRLSHDASTASVNGTALASRHWQFVLSHGGIQIRHEAVQYPVARDRNMSEGWRFWYTDDYSPYPIEFHTSELQYDLYFAGFQLVRGDWTWTDKPDLRHHHQLRSVTIPLWCPVIVFAIAPGIVAARWFLRRRRFSKGCCTACGYDLRATPARCPECGTESKDEG
jgi:hypothetical protein